MIRRTFLRVVVAFAGLPAIGPVLPLMLGHGLASAAELDPDEIDATALAAAIGRGRVLLVDVRLLEEYSVSRIAGAIRVDPAIDTGALVRRLGARITGTDVVLYCTLGPRSAGLGINAGYALVNAGAKRVRILKGGVIAWANAGLPLVDHKGATRNVHPSDQATALSLTDPSRARFAPRR